MAKKNRIPKHKAMSFNRSLVSVQGGLPVSRNNWSVQSQGSYSYYFTNYYDDEPYRCRVCRAKCVFTASEQKHAYEVEKRYIDQRRVYCQGCYQRLNQLLNELREAEKQWTENKRTLVNNTDFLTNWLARLNELATFRTRTNAMVKQMLEKRLEELTGETK